MSPNAVDSDFLHLKDQFTEAHQWKNWTDQNKKWNVQIHYSSAGKIVHVNIKVVVPGIFKNLLLLSFQYLK